MARRVNPKRLEASARAGWTNHDIVSVRQAEAMLLAWRLFGHRDPSTLHALTLNLRRIGFDEDIIAAIRAERRRLRNICCRYLPDVAMAFWFELAGSGNLHVHCIVASSRPEDEIVAILTGAKIPVGGRRKAHKRPSLFHEQNAAHIQAFRSTGAVEQEMLRWSWYACKAWWRSTRTDKEHKAVTRLFRLVPVGLLTGRIGTNRKDNGLGSKQLVSLPLSSSDVVAGCMDNTISFKLGADEGMPLDSGVASVRRGEVEHFGTTADRPP